MNTFWVRSMAIAAIAIVLMSVAIACGTGDDPPEATPTLEATAGPLDQPTLVPTSEPTAEVRDMEAYFSGQTVRIVVGTAPGGGYDTFARILANHFPDHLPGSPQFVVENRPGSGQLLGLRTAMESTPDGLTMGMLHPRWVSRTVLGEDIDGVDLLRSNFIGTPTAELDTTVYCVQSDLFTSWNEVVAAGATVNNGDLAPGNPGPAFLEILGGPIESVYGYGGASEVMAAFDRGEINGMTRCSSHHVDPRYPEWIEQQRLALLFWWHEEPPADYVQRVGFSAPIHIFDAAEQADIELTESQKTLFDVQVGISAVSNRTLLLPPETPQDIVAVWRDALRQTTGDEDFIEAVQAAGYAVSYGEPDQLEDVLERAQSLSTEDLAVLQQLLAE